MRTAFVTFLITLFLDQLSKVWVVHWLNLKEIGRMEVLPPLLNFRMAWNRGVNFGLFANDSDAGRWVLIGIALVISVFVIWWMHRDPPGKGGLICAGLLVGGALGNVVDRVLYGAVADFINMSCCGINNPFAFNLADTWIFVGAFGLIFLGGTKKPS